MERMTKELSDFDSLWDYSRPAETEARFRELLPAAEDSPALGAELLTQIARAQGLQGRFAEARATLDDLEPNLSGLPLRPRIRYLLELGRVYNSSGDPALARPFFAEALQLAAADPRESFFAVDAAHMLAIVAAPEEALAWNLRALELVEASTDSRTRNWRGSLLNNIGWSYHEAGDFNNALEFMERALDIRREQGQAAEIRIARWCVARVRRNLGQLAAALSEQRTLLAEYDALDERSGYVYEEIGECLLGMGDSAAARSFFALAYQELAADPWLVAHEPARMIRLKALGNDALP
jgi:tetratricopeptide (TPR) repeat protein